MIETKFPDTESGAMECLLANSTYQRSDLVRAIPDPVVYGVWKIILTKPIQEELSPVVIVYMAGYPDQFGNIREETDFEEGY